MLIHMVCLLERDDFESILVGVVAELAAPNISHSQIVNSGFHSKIADQPKSF